jgi:hypothetical protein
MKNIFIGLFLVLGLFFITGCSQEGIIKISNDCRNEVKLTTSQYNWKKIFSNFICEYQKSNSGKITSGICAHFEMNSGVCITAYIYEVPSDVQCSGGHAPDRNDVCQPICSSTSTDPLGLFSNCVSLPVTDDPNNPMGLSFVHTSSSPE